MAASSSTLSSVCVYCASNPGADPAFVSAAASFGQLLARRDVRLIYGGGRVGLFRGDVAARHPSVEWIGLAEKNPNRAGEVAPKIGADELAASIAAVTAESMPPERPRITPRNRFFST